MTRLLHVVLILPYLVLLIKQFCFPLNGKTHLVRMLLDSGSMSHFITLPCAQKLGLPIDNTPTSVQGIGSTNKSVSGQTCFTFSSRFDPNVSFSVHALVVDHVTSKLPTARIQSQALKHLQGMQVSDDTYYEPQSISGILGASLWPLVIQSGQIIGGPNSPIGVCTKLGIVVMGTAPIQGDASDGSNHTFCTFAEQSLDTMVHKLWELEDIPDVGASPYNDEEALCEELYKNTVSRDVSGRFTVALPFKESPDVLGDSYMNAKKRLLSLEKKLEKSPEFRQGYNEALRNFIDSGHMSLSDNHNVSGDPVFILPHHAVIKQSSSTPIRPVFDGSCVTSTQKSLNDILFSGPNIYSDLFVVLCNMRLFSIGICSDIRKMFRQIFVRPQDREFQKILWRFDPHDPVSVYTLNTVVFGLKPSPWLALRTVKQLVIEEGAKYPIASHVVSRDIYMDDLVTSVADEHEAKELYTQLKDFFRSGGFELVKWSSNSLRLLQDIPESDRLLKPLELEDKGFQKILGMQWESKDDFFSFRIEENASDTPCTKRSILSFAAKIWDILGFLCPVIIKIKILLQQLWSQHLDWDDTPPYHIVKTWNEFRLEFQKLSQLKIPRHLGVLDHNMPVTLVGFSDASEKAYACVIYCRVVLPNDDVIVRFVCAKSKVAPLKTISIPRLELCGALLLSKLMFVIINTFQSRCNISDTYCFSDSTVALNWIKKCPSQLNTFVANRVTKIQHNVEKQHWFHCSGSDNPADYATRGLTPSELMHEHCIWFTGPSWLSQDITEWNYHPVEVMNSVPEEKKVILVSVENKPKCPFDFFSPIFKRFSSWSKLLHMFVYVLRFVKIIPTGDNISYSDIKIAEHYILKIIQKFHFSDVFDSIHRNEPCSPSIRKLNPFIQGSLLRVGGRLVHSDLNYEQKHPILLPQKDHVVTLLVEYHHKINLHTGSTLLFCLLRNNYWILGARNLVRKVVRSCNICFRCKPESTTPLMGNLPEYRVQPAVKAFIHTGLDMAGPFHITLSKHRGVKSQKAYLCLFICMCTKALHLELVSEMTTESFMAAFKRFISRRGPVLYMYSDNGSNFVGAKNKLDEDFRLGLIQQQIIWKFSPPSAPHMSGIWESGVKCVKTHLYRVIGTQILTYEELNSIFIMIEGVLNSKPLCKLSTDDSSEPVALTPAHFLTFQPLAHLPARDVLSEPANRLTRYQLLDQMVQSFWKRWSNEYLHTLQVRSKWTKHADSSITVGTVVLIKQDNFVPPLQWPLGVVVKVSPGTDGIVRVADVKTKNGIFRRPVVKLCPLPTQ
uniref:Integrase catalytic domain-containing protein n=1 Tax=Cacopsylla melanoneura TaxID=428564 RepID=A0A8D8SBS8_9HEMI